MKKGLAVTLLLGFLFAETLAFSLTLKVYFYPLKYTSEILNISQTVNIDPEIIASIINVESGYNKNAKSNAGAIGLMQIMPSTASYISNLKNIEYSSENDLYLPEKNIEIGTIYLKYLIAKFDNFYTAIASFNAGETIVRNWLKNKEYSNDGKTLFYIPYTETRNYLKKIKNNIKIYSKYKIYKNKKII